MKNLFVFSLFALTSTMSFANESAGEGPENATETPTKKILAETLNPKNIHLNGKSYERCILYKVDEEEGADRKKVSYIKVGIGNKDGRMDSITLFKINENGEYAKGWQYAKSYEKIANQLTQKDLDYGYRFDASNRKISYTNGSSCMDQDSFKITLENGNLDEVKSVQWSNGMCNTAQFLLAVPSAIFGADRHGNDLKCKFTN